MGGKKTHKYPNFNLGILKTEGGGLYLSKMSQYQLFDSVVCNKEMSLIQKCPNLVRGGGGGVNPNWDIVPNFLDFLF